ncbi:uncharacterized protein EI97DRAFT_410149 [Westerdykella ornata]|uniref:PhoD-like phosphatase domain-containing protein n=1 Tax=Westerdykella ornata TaxID=318751 RepID=A0A6A6K001_WESOR|nr:uncharacterized protein EI97DRAFT_410149 [Westerdykella ornata]KAF2281366.1 hypothetical protein EI97DRAFT_410149 [Westerdykella ornata]
MEGPHPAPPSNGNYTGTNRSPNAPQRPLGEGYPQKRTSYRRPIDAQSASAPAPVQYPAVPNAVSSNSARPISAVGPTGSSGIAKTSSHRRRQSQFAQPQATQIPPAPDVPRGPPPSSYRDPYAHRGSSRSHTSSRSYPRSRDHVVQANVNRLQPNIQIAPDRLRSPAEPPAGATPTQQRRPSVPDRSPLQKLEGKLDDISKEERRTRMQELELEAQERAEAEARARRALQAAVNSKQQRNVSGPLTSAGISSTVPGRSLNARRHVSMPAPPRSRAKEDDDLDGSEDGIVYDLSEPWDPSGGGPGVSQAQASRQSNQAAHVNRTSAPAQPIKSGEPAGLSRGLGSFRDRSGGAQWTDRAVDTDQRIQRNAIADTKGLGLYGVDDAPHAARPLGANIGRYDSRRLSKDLPPVPAGTVQSSDRRRDSRGIIAAQMEMKQEQIDQKNGTRGPSSAPQPHDPPTSTAAEAGPSATQSGPEASRSSHHHHHLSDMVGHHEPERRYVPPPMLQEWKDAPVAALLAEDLDLDVPERSESIKKAWWEESSASRRRRSGSHGVTALDEGHVDAATGQTSFSPPLYLKCGPLLRYTGIRRDKTKSGVERFIWRGSVMIVTIDQHSSYNKVPTLRIFKQPMDLLPPPPTEIDAEGQPLHPAYVDPLEGQTKMSRTGKTLYVKPIDEIPENSDPSRVEDDRGLFQEKPITSALDRDQSRQSRLQKKSGEKVGKVREIAGVRLHAERGVTFWRFNIEVELGSSQTRIAYRINRGPAVGFWVPGKGENMNIMFYSCNGFSYGVDSKDFCGPDPMFRDVLNNHQTRPFHVMIGGGDQIYNDAAMRETTLFKDWIESRNPLQKHKASFSEEMQNELEQFYLDRYSMWFSQGLFGMANAQIPMVNIWDDHDIIDGFGSYPHHFMSTPVFTGLGAVAFKYYMLFQHQSVVSETEKTEPSWVLGAHPGPYIKEQSRSVFMSLGKTVALLGLDCRTERRRDEILTEDSYDIIFDRLEDELVKGETKHLIVLLGVPIAYPRLNFLENVLTSRLMDPIKALGRMRLLGNFVNKFDGGVEILDDLDDHWTAKHHKEERNWFIQELQHIARTKSVRVTILGGDVHLAAVGQFYSNKKLGIPKDKDHRYMPNVISSAVVNTPPPDIMADILNKRNKVHHLDASTDEDMIPLFTHDVDDKKRNNVHLMPRRNWCNIREYSPGSTPPATPVRPKTTGNSPRLTRTLSDYAPGNLARRLSGHGQRGRDRGPPVSYYNNPAFANAAEEQAGVQSSFSPDSGEQRRSRRNSLSSLFRSRASVDSIHHPPASAHRLPAPNDRDDVSIGRPSPFHRRPSVLGRRGLKREGEYIDLQGGLDIFINVEVSRKDPAGITAPYRLSVPVLRYEEPESEAGGAVAESERRKSRIGSFFGVLGTRRRRTVGDNGYSHSGSSIASQSGGEEEEADEEERARQRYKVGPRILIPGFSKKRDSAAFADGPTRSPAERRMSSGVAQQSSTTTHATRRVSAPVASSYNTTPALAPPPPPPQSQTTPTRSASTRQPTHNSSHKSQLPAPAPEPKTYRRSMGGILNQQQRDPAWERQQVHHGHGSHAAAAAAPQRKRDSWPPHPAIVGQGPGSPYSRGQLEPRDGHTGGYFASGGGARNGNAGVGARYLGGGRYADGSSDEEDEDEDEEDEGRYSDEVGEQRESPDSFLPPKTRSKWKIWKA